MIVLDAATKTFRGSKRPALDSISATIRPGRITGLVGPDGAGKTTLLRLIAGLLAPTSGRVEAFGLDATRETGAVRRFLGYMPQKFGLYEDLTALENLELYAKLREVPKKERKERFAQLLELTGLEKFGDRLTRRFSGGMKQKLGLACALITTPKLLVLDEPGVGVDPLSRRELWKLVRERLTPEAVVLWSTAYLDEAEICDETILLNEGKLIFAGPPRDLSREVAGRVVRVVGIDSTRRRDALTEFLKKQDVVDGTIQGKSIRLTLSRPFRGGAEEGASETFAGLNEFCERDASGRVRIEIVETAPRFEDGFIERLGGVSKEQPRLIEPSATRSKSTGKSERNSEAPVVLARGLTKRFGSFVAAQNIDFAIRRGEIFGLLGPNGAGKSTTFKMLCGLLRPTSGEGFVAGTSLTRSPGEARRRLGYMAQKFSLYGDLTVLQNLNFFAGVYGLSTAERKRAVAETLSSFDLEEFAKTTAGMLPLGFKQRLALATATIHSPEVLFLDEPTSGVDPLARREFWTRVDALARRGVATLVTTHFMDEAEYCDRAALILNGRKIAEGTPDDLKRAAATDATPEPTLEDAFVRLVEEERRRGANAN